MTRLRGGLSVIRELLQGLLGGLLQACIAGIVVSCPNYPILLCWTQRCPVFKLCPSPCTSPARHCLSVGLCGVPLGGCIRDLPWLPWDQASTSRSRLAPLSRACTAFCLFVSVDEKEVTSSLLSLPLTHFGCGQGRSLFVTIKNHTGSGHPCYRKLPTGLYSVS